MAQKDLTAPTTIAGTDTQAVTGSTRGTKHALDVADITSNELTYIDEASSTVTYVGNATIGSSTASSVWKIKKIAVSGTVTSILFADGDALYNNIWDNRAALSYS